VSYIACSTMSVRATPADSSAHALDCRTTEAATAAAARQLPVEVMKTGNILVS
jgi:hypothetical protein